jgi:hypothetical protein
MTTNKMPMGIFKNSRIGKNSLSMAGSLLS